jgi:Domain of unknown function (DUF4369)
MKTTLSILIGLFLLIGCSSSENEMKLTGEIAGLRKGMIYLQRIDDTTLVTIDSIKVNGKAEFHFNTEIISPEVYYITMQFADSMKTRKSIAFFAEPSEIMVNSKLENFEIESTVSGSVNQEKWDAFQELMKRYKDKNLELIEKQFNALKDGRDSILQATEEMQKKLLSSRYLATVNFAKNNNDFEIAPYLMLSEVPNANLKYHDTIYKLLTPKIKDSKYGKALESFIQERKTE